MIRRELPRDPPHVPRLPTELILAPVPTLLVIRPLHDDLDPLPRDRAEGSVGVGELPAVEARVHELPSREEVAHGGHAQHDEEHPDRRGRHDPPQRHARHRPRQRGLRRPLRSPDAGEADRGEREHDRRPVQPREVPGEHEPQLRRDHDAPGDGADPRGPFDELRVPSAVGEPEGEDRREQEERHDELRDVVADHLELVEPPRQQMRLAAQRPRHRLRLVVEGHRGEVAPLASAADLDHPGAELQPEQQPPEQHDHDRRRWLVVRAEECREESRLQQQHLPPERVEGLPHAHHRHVSEPQGEKREHRHPRRSELGNPDDEQRGDDDPRPGQGHQAPVRVADVGEERGVQQLPALALLRHPVEQHGRGQEPVLAEERTELVQRRDERDEVQRRDAPLQDFAGEPEVDRCEPVHGHRLRRGRPSHEGVARSAAQFCIAICWPFTSGYAASSEPSRSSLCMSTPVI